LAVQTAAVATPAASVTAVFTPPANVPLAPPTGGVNVTVTPGTRFPPLSLTVACRFTAKAVLIKALCGVPAVAVTVAGAPTRFVSAKLAGAATPTTVAATV
jgi:hypothetical protein